VDDIFTTVPIAKLFVRVSVVVYYCRTYYKAVRVGAQALGPEGVALIRFFAEVQTGDQFSILRVHLQTTGDLPQGVGQNPTHTHCKHDSKSDLRRAHLQARACVQA
jgi:hypothetical protein